MKNPVPTKAGGEEVLIVNASPGAGARRVRSRVRCLLMERILPLNCYTINSCLRTYYGGYRQYY